MAQTEKDELVWDCGRRCCHGGCCILPEGHEGNHDTEFCQFSEAEALSDEDGDNLAISKRPDIEPLIRLGQVLEALRDATR